MLLQVGADTVRLPADHGELPAVCDRTIKGDMIHLILRRGLTNFHDQNFYF